MTQEEIKSKGIEFSVSYMHGEKDMTLYIYDKSGRVRAKQRFNEQMLNGLKDSIEVCLGLKSEEE